MSEKVYFPDKKKLIIFCIAMGGLTFIAISICILNLYIILLGQFTMQVFVYAGGSFVAVIFCIWAWRKMTSWVDVKKPVIIMNENGIKLRLQSPDYKKMHSFKWKDIKGVRLCYSNGSHFTLIIGLSERTYKASGIVANRMVEVLRKLDDKLTNHNFRYTISIGGLCLGGQPKLLAKEIVEYAEAAGIKGYHDNLEGLKKLTPFDWHVIE